MNAKPSKIFKLGQLLKKSIVNIYGLKELKVSDLKKCLKESLVDFDSIKSLKIVDVSSNLTLVTKLLSCLARKVEETELVRFYEMLESIAKDDEDLNAAFRATNVNTGELLDEIKRAIDSFDPEKWDGEGGDPLSFPAVKVVLKRIENLDNNKKVITKFKIVILKKFQEVFSDYYDTMKNNVKTEALYEHLEEMKALAEYKFLEDLEDEIGYIPPIKEYYQPNPCVKRDIESWKTGPVRQSSEMNIEDVVEIFLKSENKVLLLAADFGTGKTTASRILASKYAEDFGKVDSANYIPVFIKLTEVSKNKIKSKLGGITVTKYQKILLILDGLDEIRSGERDKIISFVSECESDYPNIKIIITTRFGIYLDEEEDEFFRNLGLKELGHFYQLMPLTEELAENMLEKLGGLSLDEVKDLGISEEEYTKPIYLYLLWVLKKAGRLEELRGYGRSGIYLALTNLVSRYKAKCVEDENVKKELKEKEELKARNVLIHIAVLRTMFESEELSKGEIEEFLSDDIRKDLDKIGADFLITTYLRDPDNLTFIHKSFQEYLSAEFLLMSFLSGRYENLYTFPLTQEILEFLRGLAKMFGECIKSGDTEEFRELLKLVGKKPEDLSIEELIVKAKECLRKQYCIPFIVKTKEDPREQYSIPFFEDIRCSGLSLRFCRFKDIENLIKLLVSGKVAVMEIGQAISENEMLKNLSKSKKNKSVIEEILRYNYLSSLNLRGAELNGAKLNGAKLNDAELIGAELNEAKLNWAELIRAELNGAKLNGAELKNINWKGLGFLQPPSVKGANFKNAKINDREFVEYLRKNGAINVPDPLED